MKSMKKAKIVNLSLKTFKDNSTTTIHTTHDHPEDPLATHNLKQQHILNDCYQAIKIINT